LILHIHKEENKKRKKKKKKENNNNRCLKFFILKEKIKEDK